MSFYIVLPSNTITELYDKSNTPSEFTIPLAEELNFTSNWEVGLQEIFIPNYIDNIGKNMTTITVLHNKSNQNNHFEQGRKDVIIDGGNYTPQTFVNKVNEKIEKLDNVSLRLKYESASKKIKFYNVSYLEGIIFQNVKLQKMLGYSPTETTEIHHTNETHKHGKQKFTLPLPVSFNTFNNILYCYTDIISKSIVGDVFSPLLRLVNRDAKDEKLSVIHQNYKKPHYHKILTKNIKEIHIKISNSLGENLSIKRGHTIIVLHFKKSITVERHKEDLQRKKQISNLLEHLVENKNE